MFIRAFCLCVAPFSLWAGDARLDVRFTPAAPSLSDVIRVEVTLSGTDDPNVVLRPPDIPSGCVAVTASSVGVNKAVVTLDPVKPGPCAIPPFRTRCLRGSTKDCDVRSAETLIPIGTVVVNPNNGDADIRDKEEMPVALSAAPVAPGAGVWSYTWWAVAAIILIALVHGGIWIWRRRENHPARRAVRLLRRFQAGGGDQAEAFSQLTVIFRDYLDERLALGAQSCTSPELISELRRRSLSEGHTARALHAFLEACDRAKFGGTAAEATDIDTARAECLSLIQTLEFYVERKSRAGV
jgi:hypothetical protein